MLVATFNGGAFGAFGAPPSNACGTGLVPDPSTGAALDPTTRVCTCPDGTTWDGESHFCRTDESAAPDPFFPDAASAAQAAATSAALQPSSISTTIEKVPKWVWVVAGGVGVLVVASIGAILLRPAAPAPAPTKAAFGRRRKHRR